MEFPNEFIFNYIKNDEPFSIKIEKEPTKSKVWQNYSIDTHYENKNTPNIIGLENSLQFENAVRNYFHNLGYRCEIIDWCDFRRRCICTIIS